MSELEVFAAVLEITGPSERSAFLAKACGGDAVLHGRIEALLLKHRPAGDFLASPAAEQFAAHLAMLPNATNALEPSAGAEEDEILDFLQPAVKPGSLGRLGHYEIQQGYLVIEAAGDREDQEPLRGVR